MAADFLGLTVVVKLNSPPNTTLQGLVANVEEQRLFLRNVYFPTSGHFLDDYVVHGTEIADIEVAGPSQTQRPPVQLPTHTSPPPQQSSFIDPAILSFARTPSQPATAPVSATLAQPFNALNIQQGPQKPVARSIPANGKQSARKTNDLAEVDESSPELSRPQPKASARQDGWRKTPILQENTAPTRKKRSKKKPKQQVQNGWATEDATDVQDLGDFDFAGNLSKFDKQAVFDQLRHEDTIADADRLVSFNRTAGTFSGRNLHPLENVLSDSDHEEASTGSKHIKRVPSRASTSRPSRKDSSNLLDSLHQRRPIKQTSSPNVELAPKRKAAFRYLQTDKICPTIEPDFLEHVEDLACTELGFNEDVLAENAARGIGEVALSAISPGGRGRHGPNSQPVVVILAGNHRTGARAMAAARHLKERRTRVVVSLLSTAIDGSALTLQYRRIGGEVLTWKDTSAFLKTLDAPPELIIDGLLGADSTLSDLTAEEQKIAMDMIGWANKSRASVLSIDLPAGVDAVTGDVEVREGEPVEARARFIVCCGIPFVGLLRAIESRQDDGDEWKMFVCDVGINAAWRMALQRSREKRNHKGINFWSGWVLGIRFDNGEQ